MKTYNLTISIEGKDYKLSELLRIIGHKDKILNYADSISRKIREHFLFMTMDSTKHTFMQLADYIEDWDRENQKEGKES